MGERSPAPIPCRTTAAARRTPSRPPPAAAQFPQPVAPALAAPAAGSFYTVMRVPLEPFSLHNRSPQHVRGSASAGGPWARVFYNFHGWNLQAAAAGMRLDNQTADAS